MIEDVDLDEIFNSSQKAKILNSNKWRATNTQEHTKEDDSSDEDQSTRISAPLDIAMDDEEKEIVRN